MRYKETVIRIVIRKTIWRVESGLRLGGSAGVVIQLTQYVVGYTVEKQIIAVEIVLQHTVIVIVRYEETMIRRIERKTEEGVAQTQNIGTVIRSGLRINGGGRHQVVIVLPQKIDGVFAVCNGRDVENRDTVSRRLRDIEPAVGAINIDAIGNVQAGLRGGGSEPCKGCLPKDIHRIFAVGDTCNVIGCNTVTGKLGYVERLCERIVGHTARRSHTGLRIGNCGIREI